MSKIGCLIGIHKFNRRIEWGISEMQEREIIGEKSTIIDNDEIDSKGKERKKRE